VARSRQSAVGDRNRHRDAFNVEAAGLDQDLAFERETRRRTVVDARLAQQAGRVDAKSRLGVGKAAPGRQPDPEVGEAVGSVAQRRHLLTQVPARADHDRPGPLAVRREQRGDLLGPVLAVAVERDHRLRAERERALHAAPQAGALAEVRRVAQHLERQAFERRGGAVARAVVNHDQRADLRQRALGDVADGRRLVVRRDHGDGVGRVHCA